MDVGRRRTEKLALLAQDPGCPAFRAPLFRLICTLNQVRSHLQVYYTLFGTIRDHLSTEVVNIFCISRPLYALVGSMSHQPSSKSRRPEATAKHLARRAGVESSHTEGSAMPDSMRLTSKASTDHWSLTREKSNQSRREIDPKY